jgi:hypothetical protein
VGGVRFGAGVRGVAGVLVVTVAVMRLGVVHGASLSG